LEFTNKKTSGIGLHQSNICRKTANIRILFVGK